MTDPEAVSIVKILADDQANTVQGVTDYPPRYHYTCVHCGRGDVPESGEWEDAAPDHQANCPVARARRWLKDHAEVPA